LIVSVVMLPNDAAPGFPPAMSGHFPGAALLKRGNMFDKTKDKINTQINDRITAPIHTAVIISVTAFIMAGLALMIAINKAS
jgi:hypothetical protein